MLNFSFNLIYLFTPRSYRINMGLYKIWMLFVVILQKAVFAKYLSIRSLFCRTEATPNVTQSTNTLLFSTSILAEYPSNLIKALFLIGAMRSDWRRDASFFLFWCHGFYGNFDTRNNKLLYVKMSKEKHHRLTSKAEWKSEPQLPDIELEGIVRNICKHFGNTRSTVRHEIHHR